MFGKKLFWNTLFVAQKIIQNLIVLSKHFFRPNYHFYSFCQTLGLVLRLRVDFVLPLSQEEQEQEEQKQEQPLTKIYQKGVY